MSKGSIHSINLRLILNSRASTFLMIMVRNVSSQQRGGTAPTLVVVLDAQGLVFRPAVRVFLWSCPVGAVAVFLDPMDGGEA